MALPVERVLGVEDGALAPVVDHAHGLEEIGEAVAYRRYLFELMSPHLDGHVLEVGAGRGDFAALFEEARTLTLTDVEPRCLTAMADRFRERPSVTVQRFDLTEPTVILRADSAVAINVLEHVGDDVAALRAIARTLPPGGNIVLFVPGYPALYGDFDRLVGHERRYTPASLARAVTDAGLSVDVLRPVNFIGGVAWWLAVKLGKRVRPRPSLVKLYDRILVPLVRLMERRWRPPFGQSILCVARTSTRTG